ncbi:hypothetical protein KC852_00280 [Candidatus Nomurabacteria bacterium]|nr:hypothetical protein [Candidatus Nomurabacteria bacterium]
MKKFYRTIGIISLALVLAIGMARMDRADATWGNADGAPPLNNVATPVNRLSPDQTRQGSMAVGYADPALADLVNYKFDAGGISFTKGTYVEGSSILEEGSAFVGTVPYNEDASVFVGGKIGIGEDSAAVTESLNITNESLSTKINSLSSVQNPDILYGAPLCADADGKVVICSQSLPITITKSTISSGTCSETISLSATIGGAGSPPYTYSWHSLVGDATVTGGTTSSSITLVVDKNYPLYSWGIDLDVTDVTGKNSSTHYGGIAVQNNNLCL